MLPVSAGKLLRNAIKEALLLGKPLQIPGTPTAYCALLAKNSGYKAIYLSGSGVAASSFGLPDLGITTLNDILEDTRRIVRACDLPLLVDVDTGFGGALNIARTVEELERAGAAGIHIEDQFQAKRCGHRPGKMIVSIDEMVDRIKTAVSARKNPEFVIMARTDSYSSKYVLQNHNDFQFNDTPIGNPKYVTGNISKEKSRIEIVLERCLAYKNAGADMIFPEALSSLEEFNYVSKRIDLPVLANMTENGNTPLFHLDELHQNGVSIALYPLSAFRAMSLAASTVYDSVLNDGYQKNVLHQMHSREKVYEILEYESYERQMDELFGKIHAESSSSSTNRKN